MNPPRLMGIFKRKKRILIELILSLFAATFIIFLVDPGLAHSKQIVGLVVVVIALSIFPFTLIRLFKLLLSLHGEQKNILYCLKYSILKRFMNSSFYFKWCYI